MKVATFTFLSLYVANKETMPHLIIFKKRDVLILSLFLLVFFTLVYVFTSPVFFVNKRGLIFVGADAQRLKEHVEFLSGLEPGRGYQYVDSLDVTVRYIQDKFLEYCDEVEVQIFRVFGDGKDYKNIICSFAADKEERIVLGAHYDTYEGLPGADDNASGVAGLLEIARILKTNSPDIGKRIDIVAYSLEEPPFFRTADMGSFRHARMLRGESVDVSLVIILEMIGYYSDERGSQKIPLFFLKPFYPSAGNFITIIGKINERKKMSFVKERMKEVMETPVYSFNGPSFITGVDFSDHLSYWRNGYPALMITDTAFYRNSRYHTVDDTPDTLDYQRMSDVINGVYWTLINQQAAK